MSRNHAIAKMETWRAFFFFVCLEYCNTFYFNLPGTKVTLPLLSFYSLLEAYVKEPDIVRHQTKSIEPGCYSDSKIQTDPQSSDLKTYFTFIPKKYFISASSKRSRVIAISSRLNAGSPRCRCK